MCEQDRDFSALLTRRLELGRLFNALRHQESAAFLELDCLDASLARLNGRHLREPRKPQGDKGEVTRRLLRILKAAGQPITTAEIVRLTGAAASSCDRAENRAVCRRVGRRLGALAETGVVQKGSTATGATCWELSQ